MLLRVMTTKIQIIVDEAGAGQRLDHYLAAQPELLAESLSRTRLQGLIESGLVWVNGASALHAKTKLRAGQIVEIAVPEAAPAEPLGEAIPLDIVFEDDCLVVLDKPAGLVVHPGAGHETGTLVNALIAHCGESSQASAG